MNTETSDKTFMFSAKSGWDNNTVLSIKTETLINGLYLPMKITRTQKICNASQPYALVGAHHDSRLE